jgi:hypothetical protein
VSWTADRERLTALARTFHPRAVLVAVPWLDRAIALGTLQLYPRSWSAPLVANRIPHESEHTAQMARLGRGNPWLGLLPFLALYLLVLPVGWAPWRVRWEIEAERAAWRVTPQDPIRRRAAARVLAHELASWRYGWAMPLEDTLRLCLAATTGVA